MRDDTRILTETSSVYLRELATMMKKGKLGVPLFQRDFVWTRKQIIQLFDSIRRGYPIGSFLLWKLDSEWHGSKDIINNTYDDNATPTWYILDGLQRLTSFYGCISEGTDKEKDFNLSYDLSTCSFGYYNSKQLHVVPVSVIYDTFSLLDRMAKIRANYDEEIARNYIDEAKQLNAQLQEFTVSRIVIEQCSLDEATEAFSRLNSEGTKISKPYMLQALSFAKSGRKSLVSQLNELSMELTPYGFDGIESEDLLNCYLIFSDFKFYDVTMSDLKNFIPLKHEKEVRQAVLKTAEFLYNDCKVEGWHLLPYRKQFMGLVMWFKEHDAVSEEEKRELIRWFYYTTVNLTFQNTSLGYVRKLFSRFEEYIKGESLTAIDYDEEDKKIDLNFGYQHNSAQSRLLMIALCDYYRKHSEDQEDIRYQKTVKYGDKSCPESYFPIMSNEDISVLNEIFYSTKSFTYSELEKYALDNEMVDSFRQGLDFIYQALRQSKLIALLTEFIKSQLSED